MGQNPVLKKSAGRFDSPRAGALMLGTEHLAENSLVCVYEQVPSQFEPWNVNPVNERSLIRGSFPVAYLTGV